MTQIITGPFGRLAYHAVAAAAAQYPALNVPCTGFARAPGATAANQSSAPDVVSLPRHMRGSAALALFGNPAKRES